MEIRGRATILGLIEVHSWRNVFSGMCIARATDVVAVVIVGVEICATCSNIWGKGAVGRKIVVLGTVQLGK